MREPLGADLFATCTSDASPVQVGGKWTARILRCLRDGPRRFTELRRALGPVTAKVLTETLRSMQADGLVTRTEHLGERLPHVEYALTPLGRTLLEPMAALCDWNARHLDELRARRAAAVRD